MKAIIRMHWQDMYFNNLANKLKLLDPYSLIKNENIMEDIEVSLIHLNAKQKSDTDSVTPIYRDYEYASCLLNDGAIISKIKIKEKLSGLDQFTYYFLNDKRLNDHFYGLLNHVDYKVNTPPIAAIGPAKWSLD